jgi:hypothetical protein
MPAIIADIEHEVPRINANETVSKGVNKLGHTDHKTSAAHSF